jgi:hypothetical protein
MVPGGDAGQIQLAGGGCQWGKCSGSKLGPRGNRLEHWTGRGLTGVGGPRRHKRMEGGSPVVARTSHRRSWTSG